MNRYYNDEQKTNETIKDGWLYTGDVGYQDEEGYLYLMDRKKDVIISGGLNVYSSEVENVIQKCEGVAQVAVYGELHPDWGEMVVAAIVPIGGKQLNKDSIIEYCKAELSSYKVPKKIKYMNALPLTTYGKIDKKALVGHRTCPSDPFYW